MRAPEMLERPAGSVELPTIQPGRDRVPTRCERCASTWLGYEEPLGPHQRGMLWCQQCSRSICWVAASVPPRRRPRAAPASPVPRTARPLWQQMPPQARRLSATCGPTCRRERVLVLGPSGAGTSSPAGTTSSVAAAWREYHDPDHHERPVSSLTWALGVLLASPVRAAVDVIATGPLMVDLVGHQALVDGCALPLTATEWDLLACLARRLGAFVDRDTLLARVWPAATKRGSRGTALTGRDPYQMLRTHMGRLRPKLGPAGPLIENLPGRGYRLADVPLC